MLHLEQEAAIVRHRLHTFVAPDYAAHCSACLEHVLQDASQVARLEMALQRADGSSVPVEIKMGYFLWEGQPLVQMIVRDITERRQATEQLQQARRLAEERAARFRLLVEMGRDMGSAPRLHTLLSLALERAIAFSGYDGGSILLLDAASGQMQVCASRGVDAVPPGTLVEDLATSISGHVLRQQQALVLEGAGDAIGTHWRSYTRAIPATICLPLVAASGDSIGVLALKSSTRPHHLSSDDQDALHLFASQLAVMIERSRLHEENMHLLHELAERERRLQDLVEKLLVSQEEERRRVAYELHDGLAQVASGAYQHLQSFASHYRPRAARKRQELEQVLELARRVVKEARMVIAGLRPTVLDDFGLASALRLEVEQRRADGWHISYDETPPPQRLPPAIETALFRIAQEALTNIRRHARTTRAHLALHCHAQAIRLEVRDWGCGFDAAHLAASQAGEHIGLLGMQERASLLGGTLHIESQPGAGTRVLVEVPLPAPGPASSRPESEGL
jgi:signal transduction histidine kinase